MDGIPADKAEKWVRRDHLQGKEITTSGGTKVGTVDDIIVDKDMNVVGFHLGRVSVEGPISDSRSIARDAFTDVEGEDAIIVDLSIAEQQSLTTD
jgi:sporulation protein YlmC with PRC-barrel domain